MRHLSFPLKLTLLVIGAALLASLATAMGGSHMARQGYVERGQSALAHISSTLVQATKLQARLEEERLAADRDIVRTTVELAGFPVVEPLAEAEITLAGETSPTILPAIKLGTTYLHESAPALVKAAGLVQSRVHFLQLYDRRLVRIAGGAPREQSPWAQGTWMGADHPAFQRIVEHKAPWLGPVEYDGALWLAGYTPVLDLGEQVIGALEVIHPLIRPEFAQFVAATGLGGAGGSCLVDPAGRILTPQADPRLVAHAVAAPASTGTVDDNEPIVWQRASNLPWGLRAITWVPEYDLLAGVTAQVVQGALVSLPVPLLLAVAIGILGSRVLLRPIMRMATAASCAEAGDYSCRLRYEGKDAIGTLAQAMNSLLLRLQTLFEEIQSAASETANSAKGLSSSAHDLLAQANQAVAQADEVAGNTRTMESNLDAVAAAMEEATANAHLISRAVEANSADIAQMAEHTAAIEANTQVVVSHAQVTVSTSQTLEESTRRIDAIIGLIHSIATRTQILALNATIEAARAGEAGRGFAVVANEIKDLSLQTTRATAEVDAVLRHIRTGTQSAREHAEAMRQSLHITHTAIVSLTEAINRHAQVSQESATAVSQLSLGLQEIASNAVAISELCQRNSTDIQAVHSATTAIEAEGQAVRRQAEELETLSRRLLRLVEDEATTDAAPPALQTPMPLPAPNQAQGRRPVWMQRHGLVPTA